MSILFRRNTRFERITERVTKIDFTFFVGIISSRTESVRDEYIYIADPGNDNSGKSFAKKEIMENKWELHIYDLLA
jgi:hypothetical protein